MSSRDLSESVGEDPTLGCDEEPERVALSMGTSCGPGLSSVVLRRDAEYTTSVANKNTRLHELPSADRQEALKLRAERLGFGGCGPRDFCRQRSALGERLPRRRSGFVAGQLPFRRELLGRVSI